MSDKTIIRVPSQQVNSEVDGLWTVAELKAMYGDTIQGLAAMNGTATDAVGTDGTVRTISFTPQVGTKG